MPRRADVSTTSRTDAMPARWPSTRGRWRCEAHRPFPSMMIATWAGSRAKFTWCARFSSADPGGIQARSCSSDIHASLAVLPRPRWWTSAFRDQIVIVEAFVAQPQENAPLVLSPFLDVLAPDLAGPSWPDGHG